MLKRQDIKLNSSGISSSGKMSCLTLLFLTFLLINPTTTSASALEVEDVVDHDNQVSTQADSGVTISFTPSSGSASLTPTTSDGASAKINISANVKIAGTGGYTIYLGGKNAALTGEKTGQTIPGATSATTFANMKTNTWGYAVEEGGSVPDSATYAALPQGQGKSLASVSGNNTNVNRTFAISFATKIGNDKPADTYSNQVTLSATSSPIKVAVDFGIETMQEMTSTICTNAKDNDGNGEIAGQLRDVRDGKYYWVSKLADGRCWMTQNLDLDLDASTLPLTSATSDVSSNWTPGDAGKNPAYTETTASSVTIYNGSTGQRSWSLGNYRITSSNTPSDCGYPKNSAANCASQFTAYTTPTTANGDTNAHYILGNHYQWNAATAGTGGSITSGTATSSICPKGWRLPTSNAGSEFETLVTQLGGTSTTDNLTKSPFYGVRGGYVGQITDYLFNGAGNYGCYWSSTPRSNYGGNAHSLRFYGTDTIDPSYSSLRSYGYSVRCVAR